MMTEAMSTVIYPKKKSVEVVKHFRDKEDIQWIDNLIGCHIFTFVRLYENGDGVYVDDEGLFKEGQYFWIHKNYPTPLAGNGILVGTDKNGNTIPASISLKEFRTHIRFIGDIHTLRYETQKANIIHDDYRPNFFNGAEYV